ncbi:hypothetical protein B0H17DRAFT_1124578 [Mycena rosella]|uniref:Uncharacterized protein n=1 Tax=Mycena rosella TaxID=1033263 RepID=A0AAD7MAV6_MYCRO|nr:hypothetical protein B0H17DRAFT_1124578 [Mycena rosella]
MVMSTKYWNRVDQLICICKSLVDAIGNLESRDTNLADCCQKQNLSADVQDSAEDSKVLGVEQEAAGVLIKDLQLYQANKGVFARSAADARVWWESLPISGDVRPLKTLAIVLFSVVPHAVEVEHLFSGLSGIQGAISSPFVVENITDDIDVRGIEDLTAEEIQAEFDNWEAELAAECAAQELLPMNRELPEVPLVYDLDELEHIYSGTVSLAASDDNVTIHMQGDRKVWDLAALLQAKGVTTSQKITFLCSASSAEPWQLPFFLAHWQTRRKIVLPQSLDPGQAADGHILAPPSACQSIP